jgi:predicted GNAT family acetyltransferase
MKSIYFAGENLTINKKTYPNGRICLTLTDEQGFPYMTATVNLPDQSCKPDETFIKDWSENEGILHALVQNDIVLDTGKQVSTGYVYANLVKVLI